MVTVTLVNTRRGHDLAPTRFPDGVRRRLISLDRLREVWADHQARRPDHQWAGERRRFFRRHVLELRTLAGQAEVAAADAARLAALGWDSADIADDLRDRLRADEEALVSMAEECRSGQPLTPGYLDGLARKLPGSDGPDAPFEHTGEDLAEAAAVETHPLIRAAHLQLGCDRALRASSAPRPRALGPFPWAVASLSLIRSHYPPLVMDHRLASLHEEVLSRPSEEERLAGLVELFADLETAALRGELSWTARASSRPPANTAPLAISLHRRLLEHLRAASASLRLVAREIDPDARVTVDAGDVCDDERYRERLDAAAERAMFTRGPGCWWASLEVRVDEGELRLLIAVQDVGAPATGVLAVTADGRLVSERGERDALDLASTDCVTLIPTDSAGERWPDVERFADDVVSRAVGALMTAVR
ncbi:hypothetical protein GCM10027294_20690 [Marinactinospora endophytica]